MRPSSAALPPTCWTCGTTRVGVGGPAYCLGLKDLGLGLSLNAQALPHARQRRPRQVGLLFMQTSQPHIVAAAEGGI